MKKLFDVLGILGLLSYNSIIILVSTFGIRCFINGFYFIGIILPLISILAFLYPVKIASKVDLKEMQIKLLNKEIEELNKMINMMVKYEN